MNWKEKRKNRDKNGSVVTLTRVISGFPSSQTLPHFDANASFKEIVLRVPRGSAGQLFNKQ